MARHDPCGALRRVEKRQFWLAHLERAQRSGGALSEYARAHGLAVYQLYSWRARVARARGVGAAPEPMEFARVRVLEGAPRSTVRVQFRNGVLVEVDGLAGDTVLATVLRAAGTLP